MQNNFSLSWTGLMMVLNTRIVLDAPFWSVGWITFVPVDVAAEVTLDLLLNTRADAGLYNMTTETAFTRQLLEDVLGELGLQTETLPIAKWKREVLGVDGEEDESGFGWMFKEDAAGNLQLTTWFSLLPDTDARLVRGNQVSAKLAVYLTERNRLGLSLSAKEVLRKHLACYFGNSSC